MDDPEQCDGGKNQRFLAEHDIDTSMNYFSGSGTQDSTYFPILFGAF